MRLRPITAIARHVATRTDGTILPIVALGMSVLTGAATIAVDVGRLYLARSSLQAAADTAAISSAWRIPDASAVTSAAIAYANDGVSAAHEGDVVRADDVTLGTWDYGARSFDPSGPSTNAVRVAAHRADENDNPVDMLVAGVMGVETANVDAAAIATFIDITACALALTPTGTGLEFNGGINVDSPDCGFAANSRNADAALIANGSSGTVSIQSLYLAGGMDDPHGIIHSTEPPITQADRRIDDPYAQRDFETLPTAVSPTANAVSTPNSTVTLEPGVYPSGFDFKGDVDLAPGTYVMAGDVKMRSQANVTGDGVTMVMDDSDIDIKGGAETDITAPATGATAGIAVMRQGGPSSSKMAGGSRMTINGAIYMPDSDLEFAGGASPAGCLQLIARRINFSGNASLSNNCTSLGANPITMTFTMLVS